ncbi:MAG: protein kinase domain-containing protein [Planctomycetaceae bacterium]
MSGYDLHEDFSEQDLVALATVLDQFEASQIAGDAPPIEQIRDGVEPRCQHYVVLRCVEIELEQAKSVTPQQIDDYLNRFPEMEGELLDVFEEFQSLGIGAFSQPSDTAADSQSPPLHEDATGFPTLLNGEHYTFKSLLGAGHFGTVYRAHSKKLNRDVAIKVLKKAAASSTRPQSQPRDEVEVLRNLNHPGIVKLLEIEYTHKGQPALVMELVEGPNLSDYLKQAGGKLPPRQAVQISSDIVRALMVVHQQGVFHFDLKPNNILIRETAGGIQPIIADFGASTFRQLRYRAGAGTPEYAAPEQFAGYDSFSRRFGYSHSRGARSDIYSVGIILYQLLTGEYPFDPEQQKLTTNWRRLLESRETRPEPPKAIDSAIPARLSNICLICLEFNPDNRFSSATDLLEALDSLNNPATDVDAQSELLRLRPLTSNDRLLYRRLLNAAPDSSLNSQIEPLIQRILPSEDANTNSALPRIVALSAPSGAGKSSWFAAGVLPTLRERDHRDVLTVVSLNAEESTFDPDAGSENTVSRLRQQLIYRLSLPRNTTASLEDILTEWKATAAPQTDRKNSTKKLLIVIDQFEQWLSIHGRRKETQLQQALQHCDGQLLQTLLIFRSDFIDRAEPFMDACGSPRSHGRNGCSIDLLTGEESSAVLDHVLSTPGAASRWPQESDRQNAQLHAGKLLGDADKRHGGVCPAWVVMVARFLIKHASDPLQLQHQHSLSDVALSHLRDLLEGPMGSPPPLASLYPDIVRCLIDDEAGDDLRRQVGFSQFQNASLKSTAADDLRHALQNLQSEDLIVCLQVTRDGRQQQVWQLTHEIWIQPLRQWLEQIRRTKAESLLANRTAAWVKSGDSRHLLSTRELLEVVRNVPAERRSADHERFIGASRFKVARNWLLAMLIAGLLPVWMTVTAVAWGVRAANLGRATPISEFRDAPWFVKSLIVSTLTGQLADRQRNAPDAGSADHTTELLPLRLALVDLVNENSDQFRLQSEAIIDRMHAVPEKLRGDVLDILQRRATAIQQLAVVRFDNAMKQATPGDQAALRADHAMLMFLLGRLTECNAALTSHDEDDSDRTLFISRLAAWLSIDQACRSLQDPTLSTLPATQAAVLTALDQQPQPTADMITVVNECLASDSAAVASTAQYLQQKWNLPASDPATRKQSGVDWIRIPEFDLFLIRVQIPADQSTGTDARELWVARTELSVGQIRAMAPNLIRDSDGSDTDALPAANRTLNEWLEIISALNERCGFPVTWKQRSEGWIPVADARGFRVLMLDEGLHVAGAGYPSARPLGQHLDDAFYFSELTKYAVGQSMSGTEKNGVLAVGSRRPNAMGFVDGLGNLSEVVLDQFSEDKMAGSRFAGNLARYTIGGDFNNEVQFMRLDHLGRIPNSDVTLSDGSIFRDATMGIRLVCDASEADLREAAAAFGK